MIYPWTSVRIATGGSRATATASSTIASGRYYRWNGRSTLSSDSLCLLRLKLRLRLRSRGIT